jgi:hypothetical protein
MSVLTGCGSATEVSPDLNLLGNASLEITVDPSDVQRGEGNYLQVRATVRNTSSRDVYANVGDAFNGSLEQETIFAALGTHATLEKHQGGDAWASATVGVLVEGSKFVVLKAGRSYTLHATANFGSGTYRIGVFYSDLNNDTSSPLPYRDYSSAFTIP